MEMNQCSWMDSGKRLIERQKEKERVNEMGAVEGENWEKQGILVKEKVKKLDNWMKVNTDKWLLIL